MSDHAPKPQRWASVPAKEMPLRQYRLFTGRLDRAAAQRFVERQYQFCSDVTAWVDARAQSYAEKWPDISANDAQGEASIDLIAWQRRNPDVRQNAEFIASYEAATH